MLIVIFGSANWRFLNSQKSKDYLNYNYQRFFTFTAHIHSSFFVKKSYFNYYVFASYFSFAFLNYLTP